MSDSDTIDALNYDMAGFDRLKTSLSDYAYDNWKKVNKRLDELLYSTPLPYTYPLLRRVCEEVLRIPVYEIKMKELGRLSIKPVWEPEVYGFSAFNGYNIRYFGITIGINRSLTNEQKLLALGHEIGHYLAHMNMYIDLLLIQIDTLFNARSERLAAERLPPEWWETYYTMTEQHADMIGSMFLVQPGLAEEIIRSAHYADPVTPDTLNYMFLLGLGGESAHFPATSLPRMIKEAEISKERALSRPYSRHETLFNRIAWCAFQPFDSNIMSDLQKWRTATEKKLLSVMNLIYKANQSGRRMPPTGTGPTRIFKRLSMEEIDGFVWENELWEPIIVDPQSGNALGYLALTLAYEPKKRYHKTDWVSWFDPFKGLQGNLEDWMAEVGRQDKGLMLFPFDPVIRAERKALYERVEALSFKTLFDYLMEGKND